MFYTNHQIKYFAWEITKKRSASDVDRLSQSLFDAQVDVNPHQIEAALFALNNPLSKGVILADEVGLGKTIEAALVLCQYWAERHGPGQNEFHFRGLDHLVGGVHAHGDAVQFDAADSA